MLFLKIYSLRWNTAKNPLGRQNLEVIRQYCVEQIYTLLNNDYTKVIPTMNTRIRQYTALLAALIVYYIVHEGAHLIAALSMGVFKTINFMGLGIQVDVYNTQMTDLQMGIFCLAGAISTLIIGYAMVLASPMICKSNSKIFRAIMYYVTITLLLLDPVYLSVLCGFFGGGDMNGIALLVPEWIARGFFGFLVIANGLLFWKVILPQYTRSFKEESKVS